MNERQPDDATFAVAFPYLIWSNEHRAWWGPSFNGYVREVQRAGRYTRYAALTVCRDALGTAGHIGMLAEIPVLAADVEDFLKGAMVPRVLE